MTARSLSSKRRIPLLVAASGLFLVLLTAALTSRYVHTDEAWIGQQVFSLISKGIIVSDLFRDLPPLNEQIVVYHKLLVWAGALSSRFAGWGLYQLRAVSAVAGLATLMMLLLSTQNHVPLRTRLAATSILALTPIFWEHAIMFRPEAIVCCYGLASFLCIQRYLQRSQIGWIVVAGAGAGLASLAHAVGLAFAAAGAITLIVEKRYRSAILLVILSVLVFLPYVFGFLTDRSLFIDQLLHNRVMTPQAAFAWWQPLVNLVEEHKRIFRQPGVIGISVAFILSLLVMRSREWRVNRPLLVYTMTLLVLFGMSPLPKITRYTTPLTPLFAMVVAQVWQQTDLTGISGCRRTIHGILKVWLVIFFLYGTGALGWAAFDRSHEIRTNAKLAALMQPGSLVIAPFDFVFEQQPHFTIQSWWGARRSCAPACAVSALEQYAKDLNVQYIILDPEMMKVWGVNPEFLDRQFSLYELRQGLPEEKRWLLEIKN